MDRVIGAEEMGAELELTEVTEVAKRTERTERTDRTERESREKAERNREISGMLNRVNRQMPFFHVHFRTSRCGPSLAATARR